jgi:hypothetical protein
MKVKNKQKHFALFIDCCVALYAAVVREQSCLDRMVPGGTARGSSGTHCGSCQEPMRVPARNLLWFLISPSNTNGS